MTAEEFKKDNPQHKDLEGDQLWNAMENSMLRQQAGDEIIKTIMPIWKTHTLRWIYYRQLPNLMIGNRNSYAANDRCSNCKKGVNARVGFIITQEDGSRKFLCNCPHCKQEYEGEPNTNFSHKLYKKGKKVSGMFWSMLDWLHFVRSSSGGRYGMFGDESRYVKSWVINNDTKKSRTILMDRKWWEYILIEKPSHNF